MKRTKKALSLILAAALFSGMTIPASAVQEENTSAEKEIRSAVTTVPEDNDFVEQTEAQGFALAMACWESGFAEESVRRIDFAWMAAGWYAAWEYRVRAADLISETELAEFMSSIGWDEMPGRPEDWLGSDSPLVFRNAEGERNYVFSAFHMKVDRLLGITLELSREQTDRLSEKISIIQHFDDLSRSERSCILHFEEKTDFRSRFPYRVRSIEIPEQKPETDPALGFEWDELVEANRVESILKLYPAVRVADGMYETGVVTWLFRHGEHPALLTDAYGKYSGQYAGCFFECGERPTIRAFEEGAGSQERLNSFLADYMKTPAVLKLDRMEENLIWADAVFSGGYRQKWAIDRETLILRRIVSLSEDGEILGMTLFDCSEPAPECAFLDSWDLPLRTVTVVWENYTDGARNIRRELVQIPADWEYYPEEALLGDYTAYTNEDYLGDYVYPGDGGDYLLFLTTVKG